MASILQHKLLNFEVTPPSKVWEKITLELNEIDFTEIKVSRKLQDFEVEPPDRIFENIIKRLNEQPKSPSKVVPVKRIAAAALVFGLAMVTGWYFFLKDPDSLVAPTTNNLTAIPDSKKPESKPITNVNPTVVQQSNSRGLVLAHPVTKRTGPSRNRRNTVSRIKSDYYTHLDVVHAADASNPITIDAPPIRDEKGDLILDRNLITSSNGNYIIVTGPNGQQTKISHKFLPLLGYLNGKPDLDAYSLYYDPESVEWKKRFQEWRKKLLQQAYVPTANNFLDIMELKEIIKEN